MDGLEFKNGEQKKGRVMNVENKERIIVVSAEEALIKLSAWYAKLKYCTGWYNSPGPISECIQLVELDGAWLWIGGIGSGFSYNEVTV